MVSAVLISKVLRVASEVALEIVAIQVMLGIAGTGLAFQALLGAKEGWYGTQETGNEGEHQEGDAEAEAEAEGGAEAPTADNQVAAG